MRVIIRQSLRLLMIVTTISLAAALVPLLAAAEEETIELKTGETIKGTIVEQTEDTIVIQHAIFGRQEIDRQDIKEKEETKVEPGLFGTRVLHGWTRSIGFGISGRPGTPRI